MIACTVLRKVGTCITNFDELVAKTWGLIELIESQIKTYTSTIIYDERSFWVHGGTVLLWDIVHNNTVFVVVFNEQHMIIWLMSRKMPAQWLISLVL